MKKTRIAIIGCGNLGRSILHGVLDSGQYDPELITVTKRNTGTLSEYSQSGIQITSDNRKALKDADLILLGLKPYNILRVLEGLRDKLDSSRHILVSLATGTSLENIKSLAGNDIPVFRAMPNTAADVKESITCICADSNDDSITNEVKDLFDNLGSTIIIEEHLMEAATILGACGIAYALRFIRAMVQGGIQIGFSAEIASAIVNQTVKGASELLIQRNEHPEFEIDKVTTPKGCTIVGLNEMEHNGFSSALIKGLVTSFQKIE